MALEKELAYFNEHLPEWIEHNRGQFAVIGDDRLLGTFTTFEEAFTAGVKEWGTAAFLIRQVTESPQVISVPALAVGMLYVHL